MLSENNLKKIVIRVINIFAIIFVSYLFFKFLFIPLLPFLLAFVIITFTRPAVVYVSKKTGLSEKFSVFMFTLVLISVLFTLCYVGISRLASELVSLTAYISSDDFKNVLDSFFESSRTFIENVLSNKYGSALFSQIEKKFNGFDVFVTEALRQFLPLAVSKVVSFLSFFPSAMLFVVIMFVSMFYFGMDYERITAFFKNQLSEKYLSVVLQIKTIFFDTGKDLFRAYFLITLITFFELLSGFLVLKVKYAVLIALFTSVVDMLPVLGTGTVLVPWSVFCFVSGNRAMAVGLLVIYGIVTLVRQIIEPKIVGSSVGLYPLVTLVSMYVGLKTIGFTGLFVFPFLIIVIKSLNEKNIIHLYKNCDNAGENAVKVRKKTFESYRKTKNK